MKTICTTINESDAEIIKQNGWKISDLIRIGIMTKIEKGTVTQKIEEHESRLASLEKNMSVNNNILYNLKNDVQQKT